MEKAERELTEGNQAESNPSEGKQESVLDIVIMAAGKGTRMRSSLPKVLHRLAGHSLLQHVLRTVETLGADRIVVVTGHQAESVEAAVPSAGLTFVRQVPQLGTGHAMQQAAAALHDSGTTLVLNGDVPLIEAGTLRALIEASGGERLALLTVELADPTGYGRIVRAEAVAHGSPDGGPVRGIVEHRDADPAQRLIREVYTGVMAAPTAPLKRWLAALGKANSQGEYYLTDVVGIAVAEGLAVVAAQPAAETEVLGVNDPVQLADLERRVQRRQADTLMQTGVRLSDPARFDLRGTLHCGTDVEIDVNCVFDGAVELGDRVRIGANCVIRDAVIAADAVIHPFTHIDGGELGVCVGAAARIGPFARLRPGAQLAEDVHIGNFVEVKNATLARGAKANHLAYLGDASVGEQVNFGAGSITANYDGVQKHRTTIGAGAHVGSNCVLVAPVSVGAGATIGAGSVITKDAPAAQLTLERSRQVSLAGWQRPSKPA